MKKLIANFDFHARVIGVEASICKINKAVVKEVQKKEKKIFLEKGKINYGLIYRIFDRNWQKYKPLDCYQLVHISVELTELSYQIARKSRFKFSGNCWYKINCLLMLAFLEKCNVNKLFKELQRDDKQLVQAIKDGEIDPLDLQA
ncbi:MAG: hypothetical protein A2504_09970 [Bdellovibrionales bacterium RIFOXYD12_FULL_39_22]|nr:MAG: hypothetical protein A2385_17605 [Bdellovibrionales bacterium RIFOXYB1_FULL_39_21]OFZ43937.1 MAG: hypothetical protein A2485_04275 [Bdellovibrionales bacterium RIFOXYC12_FULL_39_17]OFZ48309.1 MAG: hypothetical protein A2404_01690 [Bdellovibrionales bacterium RIFOXYC1_FULL_39_130]OFZ69525.1 MAG: hypothetical protein A2451_04010 [Bdellovibrionales bacterium RIFOXYC2_FULL_39_8]OFZ94900.1 MAG: hypothetical protein A2504_09970 [Bdellovibrionales bacterium RIFOXYD12_FULL_39_22]HLE12679.1 hyp